MLYSTIRTLAFSNGSPLYRRDVEKLDRQDDNAASRLFSADTLSYLTNHYPDRAGEIVYLFVFGDLIDAYQNRALPHRERVKMVLRAKYFLDYWEQFLESVRYLKSQHFLLREATHILQQIIEGLLALIYIYRDHLSNHEDINPLLPWLHSTEQCEHIFGEARQIVTDFCFLDLIYMLPKLRVTVRESILRARLDSRATASGYSHTHFNARELDIPILATFPDDNAINGAAREAADEAESLLALLGVSPKQLHQNPTTTLPSVSSLLPDSRDDREGEMKDAEGEDEDDTMVLEAQELQDLVQRAERSDGRGLPRLAEAVVMITADEHMRMYVVIFWRSFSIELKTDSVSSQQLPELDSDAEAEATAEEFMRLSSLVKKRTSLPALLLHDEAFQPPNLATSNLNFSILVELRRSHQTRYAAEGVRTRDASEQPEETIRRKLIRELNAIIKQQKNRAPGTGQDQKSRWLESNQGDGSAPDHKGQPAQATAGNAANAATVGRLRAETVCTQLHILYPTANISSGTQVSTEKVCRCQSSAVQPASNSPGLYCLPHSRWSVCVGFPQ